MFNNAYHVLEWAYAFSERPIVKTSSINRMIPPKMTGMPNDLLQGLGVQERHGQAAAVLGMVDRLDDPAARAYIAAKFGHRLEKEEMRLLTYRICGALGLPLGGADAVYLILKGYFGGRIGYRAVRKILGCRDQYAIMVKSCVFDALDTIHDRAMADLHTMFAEHGLIGTHATA